MIGKPSQFPPGHKVVCIYILLKIIQLPDFLINLNIICEIMNKPFSFLFSFCINFIFCLSFFSFHIHNSLINSYTRQKTLKVLGGSSSIFSQGFKASAFSELLFAVLTVNSSDNYITS